MTLFGRDLEYLEVMAAEFLPSGTKLYVLVADSDCNLHVLQYDPEGTGCGATRRSRKKDN